MHVNRDEWLSAKLNIFPQITVGSFQSRSKNNSGANKTRLRVQTVFPNYKYHSTTLRNLTFNEPIHAIVR